MNQSYKLNSFCTFYCR